MGGKDSDKARAVEGKLQTHLTDLWQQKPWVYYVRNPSESKRLREKYREREFDDLCKSKRIQKDWS